MSLLCDTLKIYAGLCQDLGVLNHIDTCRSCSLLGRDLSRGDFLKDRKLHLHPFSNSFFYWIEAGYSGFHSPLTTMHCNGDASTFTMRSAYLLYHTVSNLQIVATESLDNGPLRV